MTATPLRAILWCAVSTAVQASEEKISLAEQEKQLRAVAEREGWQIVDTLIVPGFSRRFYNFLEFASAAASEGIHAPNDLLAHWQRQDFDLLACRYGSRFGREQSIFGEVVARIIDMGARLYTLESGWIDKRNYRMYISMGGYAAASEVDRLINGYQDAMTDRASKGIPVSPRVPMSHRVIRDERGKSIGIEVNPARRRLLDDLAIVLLTGVSWDEIPLILYEQYGHTDPKGKPWAAARLWRCLHSPWAWGNGARKYTSEDGYGQYGIWAFDPSAPAPEGAQITWNTHAPLYTGDVATQVQAELKRRSEIITGRARPHTTSAFSGLLMCGGCGCRLRYRHNDRSGWTGYDCQSRAPRYRLQERHQCTSYPRAIKQSIIQMWFEARLGEMLDAHNPTALLPQSEPENNSIAAIEAEIASAERRLEGLILQRADIPPGGQSVLTELIARASEQLAILRQTLADARRRHAHVEQQRFEATYTLEEIQSITLKVFWQQDSATINRMLLSLLGDNRVYIYKREIRGVALPAHTARK